MLYRLFEAMSQFKFNNKHRKKVCNWTVSKDWLHVFYQSIFLLSITTQIPQTKLFENKTSRRKQKHKLSEKKLLVKKEAVLNPFKI